MKPTKDTLIKQWRKGSISSIPRYPLVVIANGSLDYCDLKCLHCYWPHKSKFKDEKVGNWDEAIDIMAKWRNYWDSLNKRFRVVYNGRILNEHGARFIEKYCEKTGDQIEIVDNGMGKILDFPDLFRHQFILSVTVSIDGCRETHDDQRQLEGAFEKSWETVLKLKQMGVRVGIISVLSKITNKNRKTFEKLLEKNNLAVNACFVMGAPEVLKRPRKIILSKEEINECFDVLCRGVSKSINLIELKHAEDLAPRLSKLNWVERDIYLESNLPNGIVVTYQPLSLLYLTQVNLLPNGEFAIMELDLEKGNYLPLRKGDSKRRLAKANEEAKKEKEIWDLILKGGDRR